jgi:hypothetical protein
MATLPVQIVSSLKQTLPFLHYSHESFLFFEVPTKIIPLPLPWISLLLAVIFALIHLAFYQWIFLDRGTLQISTLITLLMIGFLRNNLIMYCRHIGYVWAIHFGWIAVMLDSVHRYGKTGQRLSELERFNLYLGSPTMLTISTFLALLSLFLLLGQDRHHGTQRVTTHFSSIRINSLRK